MKRSFVGFFAVSIVFTLLIINSCGLDEYSHFEEVKIQANPELLVPLAFGNLKMEKLISAIQNEDSLFGTKPNGDLYFAFKEDSIFEISVDELIDIKELINIGSLKFDIGTMELPLKMDYSISLEKLISIAPGQIGNIKQYDGKNYSFPPILYFGFPPALFEADPINQYEKITFESGKLIVQLTNRLKIFGVYVELELIDLTFNKTISTLRYGFKDRYPGYDYYYSKYFNDQPFGLPGAICLEEGAPGPASEEIEVDLAGLTLGNHLAFRLRFLSTNGSGALSPVLDLDDGLDFKLKFENALINSGRLKIDKQNTPIQTRKNNQVEIADGVKLHKGRFISGTLLFNLSKSPPVSGKLHLSFPSILNQDGTVVSFSMPLDPFQKPDLKHDLSNVSIDFSENEDNPFNTITYQYFVEVDASDTPVDFNANDFFSCEFKIENINLYSAEGDFGNTHLPIDSMSFSLFPDGFSSFNGDFALTEPVLKILVHNSVSMPVFVDLEFHGINNNGKTSSLERQPFVLPYPKYPDQFRIDDEVPVNKHNSNLVEFISLPPQGPIHCFGNVTLNPDGPPTLTSLNYIRHDSKIVMGLAIEFPLSFTSKVILTDTINFNGSILNKIERGELIINADNGWPLGIDLEIVFIDSLNGNTYGPSTSGILLEAAKVDDQGNLVSHTVATHSIVLTELNIPEYRKANALVLKATVATPDQGKKPARLNNNLQLFIQLGLKAKVDLSYSTDNE